MSLKNVIIASLAVLLTGSLVAAHYATKDKDARINELENELAELKKLANRSTIDKIISQQLEQIAFDQEKISDERRREAELQSALARQKTQEAEAERKRAEIAKNEAIESEKNARQAQENAEKQRQIAEENQRKAEYSKSVVDTLSFVGLGRSLASLSSTQYIAGAKETAAQLAAAACYFTSKYKGSFYDQSVLGAMLLSGGGTRDIALCQGAIHAAEYMPDGNLIAVSTYGEIYRYSNNDTTRLFSDKAYNFRDLKITDDGTGYALSFSGDIIVIRDYKCHAVNLGDMRRTFRLSRLNDGNLLVAAGNTIGVFDTKSESITKTINCPGDISCITKNKVFDTNGKMYELDNNFQLIPKQLPFNGIVTAYAETDDHKYAAYGTKNGTIFYTHPKGVIEFAGHRSQISDLCLARPGLFSASLDKTVKLWTTREGTKEPIDVYSSSKWVMCLAINQEAQRIVSGDASGALTICTYSISEMKSTLKKTLKRDFNELEWNYYIGKNIPYTSIIDKL
jgi:WD40 repeat protein